MDGLSDVRFEALAHTEALPRRVTAEAPQAFSRWGLMVHRWRTRRALLQLTDHELRDVGLGQEEARREGRKPFWRP
nr:DUF1127 domain-containing protein [uncultured Pseudomonas sp.]